MHSTRHGYEIQQSAQALNFKKLMIDQNLVSRLMDLVHVKFGDDKFGALAARPIEDIGPFFRSLCSWHFSYEQDLVTQVHSLMVYLETLPNHPDAATHEMEETLARLGIVI